jgi:hypothetical protein
VSAEPELHAPHALARAAPIRAPWANTSPPPTPAACTTPSRRGARASKRCSSFGLRTARSGLSISRARASDPIGGNRSPSSSIGYEDAYRQFIEPVVGASGDRLPQAV